MDFWLQNEHSKQNGTTGTSVPCYLTLTLLWRFHVAKTHNVYVRSFRYKTILFDAVQVCLLFTKRCCNWLMVHVAMLRKS